MEIEIDVSKLKSEGSNVVKDLTEYVKEKTKVEVQTTLNEIIVKGEEKIVSKKRIRVFLRKFLYQNELADYFRVIGGKENTLVFKEKKTAEEE